MNLENKPMLAALLQEGLKSVTITRRGQPNSLSLRDYQLRVLRYRNIHDSDLLLDTLMYEPHIGESRVRQAVLDLLRDELEDFLHEDRTLATYAIFGRP